MGHFSLIAGDAIDYLEKVLAIAATIAGGTFFFVQWYMRSSRRRREASFAGYMERVIQIENESMQNELVAQLDLATLIRLQRELAVLKSNAVSKFAAVELEGEGLIHGFLALVNRCAQSTDSADFASTRKHRTARRNAEPHSGRSLLGTITVHVHQFLT